MPGHLRAALGIAEALNRRWDTVIMGRATYEPALAIGVTSPYPHLRQYVVSSTLTSPDPAVQVIGTDPVEAVRDLKGRGGPGIYLAGGARLAGALVEEIDVLVIKVYPVLAGAGVPILRDATFRPRALRRTGAVSFDSGHQIVTYERV